MPSSTRRALLASGGAALAALAGCNRSGDPPEYPILERISVANHHDEPHPVAVYADLEGEVALWRDYDLTAAGGDRPRVTIEPPTLPREEGRWHVGIRRLDADARHAFVPQIVEDQCLSFTLFVTENGGLNHGVESRPCEAAGQETG